MTDHDDCYCDICVELRHMFTLLQLLLYRAATLSTWPWYLELDIIKTEARIAELDDHYIAWHADDLEPDSTPQERSN